MVRIDVMRDDLSTRDDGLALSRSIRAKRLRRLLARTIRRGSTLQAPVRESYITLLHLGKSAYNAYSSSALPYSSVYFHCSHTSTLTAIVAGTELLCLWLTLGSYPNQLHALYGLPPLIYFQASVSGTFVNTRFCKVSA
jgi:hypothetical protein